MAVFSRLAAAVVASTLFSSVLVTLPAVAAFETGLEAGTQYHKNQNVARHDALAKSRKVKKAKRGSAKRGKSGVCSKSSTSTTVNGSTSTPAGAAAPTTTTTTASTSEHTTTSSSSVAPIPTPPSTPQTPPGDSKFGLSWNDGNNANMNMFIDTGKATWYYTWSPWAVDAGSRIEHVPMYWGPHHKADFDANFDPVKHKWMLALNEPDEGSQLNMSPADAAAFWMQEIAWRNVRKVSPAPTGSPRGIQWLKDFMAICGPACGIEAVAVHYYGTQASEFIAHVEEIHNAFGLPLWITELACQDFGGQHPQCDEAQTYAFMHDVVAYIKASPFIVRSTWFGTLMDMFNVNPLNRLMDASGQSITPFGYAVLAAH